MPIINLEKISEIKGLETSLTRQIPNGKEVYGTLIESRHIENTEFAVNTDNQQAPSKMDSNYFIPIIGYSMLNVILEDLEGGQSCNHMYRAYKTDSIKNPESLVVAHDEVDNNPDLVLMDGFLSAGEYIPRKGDVKHINETTIHKKGFSYDNSKSLTTWILLQIKEIRKYASFRMEVLAIPR